MQISVETITPEKAQEILDKNIKINRKVRSHSVEVYAQMMKQGNWQLTHQGIAISDNGELLDGQHRLMAIIKSGVTLEMMVARGLHDQKFNVFDRGIKRNDADVLGIDPAIAEACRNLAIMMVGGTASQNIALVDKIVKSEIGDIFRMIVEKTSKRAKVWSSATTKIAVAYVIYESLASPEYALNLYEKLVKSKTEEFPSVAHVMFRKYTSQKMNSLARDKGFLADMVFLFTEKNKDRKSFHDRENFAETIHSKIVRMGRSVI